MSGEFPPQSPAATRSAPAPGRTTAHRAKVKRERFVVHLVDEGDPLRRDVNRRLRQFLKVALRRWALRCVRIADEGKA